MHIIYIVGSMGIESERDRRRYIYVYGRDCKNVLEKYTGESVLER